jgi:hypothetical protein
MRTSLRAERRLFRASRSARKGLAEPPHMMNERVEVAVERSPRAAAA